MFSLSVLFLFHLTFFCFVFFFGHLMPTAAMSAFVFPEEDFLFLFGGSLIIDLQPKPGFIQLVKQDTTGKSRSRFFQKLNPETDIFL